MLVYPRLMAALLAVFLPCSALAQLFEPPSAYPMPDVNLPDPDRALALSLTFNAQTGVTVDDLTVSNRRARSALGPPPELSVELYRVDGSLISSQFMHNPLFSRDWGENGDEATITLDESSVIFFVAMSVRLARVRIMDVETGAELADIDVSSVVDNFCQQNSPTPICPIFGDGFE